VPPANEFAAPVQTRLGCSFIKRTNTLSRKKIINSNLLLPSRFDFDDCDGYRFSENMAYMEQGITLDSLFNP
jgi:hypothetical protein